VEKKSIEITDFLHFYPLLKKRTVEIIKVSPLLHFSTYDFIRHVFQNARHFRKPKVSERAVFQNGGKGNKVEKAEEVEKTLCYQ